MRPAAPNPPSAEPLAAALRRCRLLRPDRVNELLARYPDAAALFAALEASGELTRFQLQKLAAGYWQGLAVGPYRVEVPVGRGGMGIVYLANDSRTGLPVALKVLPKQKAGREPRLAARFDREAELARALPRHPHLAVGLGDGDEDGVRYLALEYVPGVTARAAVRRGGALPLPDAARLFADAAAGLAASHAAGVVHRDVKPANVMRTPEGRGVLLDFGLALRPGEPPPADPSLFGGPGYAVGTFDYLAPEQAVDSSSVGPPADAYGLGCSLFFALTGVVPFPADGPNEKMRRHRKDAPPPLPGAPADVARLVAALLEKSPADRPTVLQARALLERHAAPAPARPEPTPARAAEWRRAAEERWLAARAPGDETTAETEAITEPPATDAARRDWATPAAAGAVTLLLIGGLAVGAWIGSR